MSNDENAKLRDLLARMREEADDAWRCVDAGHAMKHHAERDRGLRGEVEALIGPSSWDALEPARHILWGDRAICHWTLHAPARWPASQTYVPITDLIVRLPCPEDETYVEYVARPDADWNGVTCDACRVRLPTLLREVSVALDDMHEGIIEGFRTHPETIHAKERYALDIEPTLTPDQRQRHAEQIRKLHEKDLRRAARRGAS